MIRNILRCAPRFLLPVWIACFPLEHARAQDANYHWTISASDTDPFVQSTTAVPDILFAYLWLVSCDLPEPLQDGMAAAEFAIVTSPNLNHLATTMENGFLNAGSGSELLILVGGCPCGPVLAATLLIFVDTSDPGVVCLEPSFKGTLGTVDCSTNPQIWPMSWSGLGINALAPDESCAADGSGGCCLPDGSCVLVASQSECAAQGGAFLGVGTDCSAPCPPGACCLPDGTCMDISSAECQAMGGSFGGTGSECATEPCAGACCLPDGSCADVASAAECSALGGMFQGKGTTCATVTCTISGACCLPDGSCADVASPAECSALGGMFQGLGTTCATTACNTAVACCCDEGCPPGNPGIAWTISGSPTDPYATSVNLSEGVFSSVYLWLVCANIPNGTLGIHAAEFDLVSSSPGLIHLATNPLNGFLNLGGVGNLLLATPCQWGPVVAAELFVLSAAGAPATLCFAHSGSGSQVVADCSTTPSIWNFNWIGLAVNGASPCTNGPACGLVSVEETSWGKIKAMYR